jgi:hypothetical protein
MNFIVLGDFCLDLKEPSAMVKMIQANHNKICIPVEIVDSNK